jgi:hypothetical protein
VQYRSFKRLALFKEFSVRVLEKKENGPFQVRREVYSKGHQFP